MTNENVPNDPTQPSVWALVTVLLSVAMVCATVGFVVYRLTL